MAKNFGLKLELLLSKEQQYIMQNDFYSYLVEMGKMYSVKSVVFTSLMMAPSLFMNSECLEGGMQ